VNDLHQISTRKVKECYLFKKWLSNFD